MPIWKKTIFVNAVKARISQENRTAEEIIQDYTKLTDNEKNEVLAEITKA